MMNDVSRPVQAQRFGKWFLICLSVFFLGFTGTASAQAASYVKASKTQVKTTSSTRRGWVKLGKHYYFYNTKGRLMYGRIKYKGNYYYSYTNGRRASGWLKKGGRRYYCSPSTGIMFRNRWATSKGKRYCFDKNGVAIARKWLTSKGRRYYFLADSTMAKGWQKIGNFYYYFDKTSGVMARNQWIDDAYVNNIGQRIATREPQPAKTLSSSHYTYTSSTLKIDLRKKSMHWVSYWAAKIHISSPSQLRSALSYGTYGGTRQTTSSAVSSNGGIIGVNGSAFSYQTGKPSPLGMCIKNGKIYGNYMTSYSVMAVKKDGTIYTPAQGLMGKDLLADGVKDTYNFGPVLIKDGKVQPAWSETAKYYPRTAIGMISPCNYVLLVTNTGSYTGLNHWDMVNIFLSYGCTYAYNLDGGGSATLYYNGNVMNSLISDYQRPCADFLYFTK